MSLKRRSRSRGATSRPTSCSAAYRGLGGSHAEPFMALSFLVLPVIPALKLTDRGPIDVGRFEVVPLWSTD